MLALETTCSSTELDVLSAQYAAVVFVELSKGGQLKETEKKFQENETHSPQNTVISGL